MKIQKKWLLIIYGILLIAVGAVTVVLSITNVEAVDTALSIALAIGLFIVGLINIVTSFITETEKFFTAPLLVGCITIAFGVVLCIHRYMIGSFIVYLIGILLLALALICILKAVIFIIYKYKVTWIVIHFVMAAIGIAGGVTVLVFRDESKMVLYAIIGSFIALLGILEVILAVRSIIKKDDEMIPEEPQQEN